MCSAYILFSIVLFATSIVLIFPRSTQKTKQKSFLIGNRCNCSLITLDFFMSIFSDSSTISMFVASAAHFMRIGTKHFLFILFGRDLATEPNQIQVAIKKFSVFFLVICDADTHAPYR